MIEQNNYSCAKESERNNIIFYWQARVATHGTATPAQCPWPNRVSNLTQSARRHSVFKVFKPEYPSRESAFPEFQALWACVAVGAHLGGRALFY